MQTGPTRPGPGQTGPTRPVPGRAPASGSSEMELQQCRIVTNDVAGLAGFYSRLLGVPTALNEYYVEIQAGPASVGFSRRRFTEHREDDGRTACGRAVPGPGRRDEIILDFLVDDVDAEYPR